MSSKSGSTRRTFLRNSAAAAAGLSLPGLISSRSIAQSGTETLNLQLGWIISGDVIGLIVADKLGFFEEEGLKLAIQPGGPNIDGIAMVAAGRSQLGLISSSPSLMLAVSQNIPIQAFASGLQQHPFSFFSLPANPVPTPKDMIGKKVGVQGTAQVLLSALLRQNDVPEDQVEKVIVGSEYSPLLTGQVDAFGGWLTNTGTLQFGPDAVVMRLWDYGVRLYAQVYYAPPETLEQNPELAARFLRAAARGWRHTYENQEEAVDILVAAYPNFDREEQLKACELFMQFSFDANTKEQGWGTFDPAVWQEQIDLFDSLDQFSAGAPKLEDVMTTRILEMTANERPKLG